MNIKILTIGLIFLWMGQCFSQKQGNIWYFGGDYSNEHAKGAGLDFNSGTAIALTNSAMTLSYGSASYCNSVGELLFYSNGQTVYDRTHHVMLNGNYLLGNPFGQQSVLIVPFSRDTNLFYIISNDANIFISRSGLNYSIIDMRLNSGNGAVTNKKSISLLSNSGQQLTGCRHFNGKDFWIITTLMDSAYLVAFQATNDGIKNPIISKLGFKQLSGFNIEISPKGNKIALKASKTNKFWRYIIDFDTKTGVFSNATPISEELKPNTSSNTGCSFSPNGHLFYDVERIIVNGSDYYTLNQYDLNDSIIMSSKLFIDSLKGNISVDLQNGPDGKIYLRGSDLRYLDRINNPNSRGINCDYKRNSVYLGGKLHANNLPNENLYSNYVQITKNDSIYLAYDHSSNHLIVHDPNYKNACYNLFLYDNQSHLILNKEVYDKSSIATNSLPGGIYVYVFYSNKRKIKAGSIIVY